MGKVEPAYFIARRLNRGEGNGVMVKIATFSIVIGLTVMVFSLSVIFGFKKEITEKLSGVLSHVQVQHYQLTINAENNEPISSDQPFLEEIAALPGFDRMNRYAVKGGILRGDEAIQGIILKGVGDDFDWSFFRKNLIAGAIPRVDSARNKDVLVSEQLSRRMNLATGDRIELLFVQDPPRRDQYRIAGIYRTDMNEIDQLLIMTDIRNVQRLNSWSADQIGGYEIIVRNFRQVDQFSDEVFDVIFDKQPLLTDELMVTNLKETHPMIFDWLETHDLNAVIIIVVMLLVAIFNMIAAMLIILLEKTAMIGILKTLGMENGKIRSIFVIRSSFIVLKGLLLGNFLGLALSFAQKQTGLLRLDAEGYFLSVVPVDIRWGYVAGLNAGVFLIIILTIILPTLIVSRVQPEKTIRFD